MTDGTQALNRPRLADEEAVYEARVARSLPTPPKPVRVADLFSGAGGLSAGFSPMAGHAFSSVWANDFEPSAAETYRLNFGPHCDSRDIEALLAGPDFEVPLADVVVGGPPCGHRPESREHRRNGRVGPQEV